MKVVLLKDVKNMGRAGSVLEVSDGHALNLLIPRKLAILATPAALKRVATVTAAANTQHELDVTLIKERLEALSEGRTVILKKANEKNHLYDAVDAKEIAAATALPLDAIHLEKPIKELGTFEIPVAFGGDFGRVTVVIEAE